MNLIKDYPKFFVSIAIFCCIYSIVQSGFRYSTLEVDNILEPLIYCGINALLLKFTYDCSLQYTTEYELLVVIIPLVGLMFNYAMFNIFIAGKKFKKIDLNGKVFIVTGCNTGLGFETAKQIVKMNGVVVMACRSPDKATQAKEEILKEVKCSPSKLIVIKLDLCGFDSVRKFVKEFKALQLPLHCLVNNAGVMIQERMLTQDGFEMVFTANHLSHFLLTNLLLPELEKTGGRVVNVSSSLHKMPSKFNFEDVMCQRSYELFACYGQSKLANVMFTKELQDRLTKRGSKVKCFALHPGCVRTEVTRNMSPLIQLGNTLATPIMMTLQKTPLQGAYCSIYVATDPELDDMQGGEYFFHCKPAAVNPVALDKEACARLWTISEKYTGLVHDR